jgi:hypothetical protein
LKVEFVFGFGGIISDIFRRSSRLFGAAPFREFMFAMREAVRQPMRRTTRASPDSFVEVRVSVAKYAAPGLTKWLLSRIIASGEVAKPAIGPQPAPAAPAE